jgi:hypothetical protein
MEILAHQGGWDEMLMVLVPIAVIVLLLRMVRNRVAARHAVAPAGAGGLDGGAEDEAGQPASTRSMSPPSDPNRPTTSS